MFTAVRKGRSFSILSSGKTTSLAQVSSVVRTKTSAAGLPFCSSTWPGENPLSSTMILVCCTPGAAGGIGTSGSLGAALPPDFEQAAIAMHKANALAERVAQVRFFIAVLPPTFTMHCHGSHGRLWA